MHGKFKFCFLAFSGIFFPKYFPSEVGWIWRFRTHLWVRRADLFHLSLLWSLLFPSFYHLLSLVYPSFSSSLRCKVKLLICNLFFQDMHYWYKLPSEKCSCSILYVWGIVFAFSFFWDFLNFPFLFLLWPTGWGVVLISTYLHIFLLSSYCWFLVSHTVARQDIWFQS